MINIIAWKITFCPSSDRRNKDRTERNVLLLAQFDLLISTQSTSLILLEHMSCFAAQHGRLCSQFCSLWKDAAVGSASVRMEIAEEGKTGRDWKLERVHTRSKNSMLVFFATDIRLCSSRPCAGNATCIETGEGGYLCICPPGYTGENCHLKGGMCLTNRYQQLLFEVLF